MWGVRSARVLGPASISSTRPYASGWICEYVSSEENAHILDHHSPLGEVGRMFPSTWDVELRLLSRFFEGGIERRVEGEKVLMVLPMDKPKPLPRETLFD